MILEQEDYDYLRARPAEGGKVPYSQNLPGDAPGDDIEAYAQEDLRKHGIPDTVIFRRGDTVRQQEILIVGNQPIKEVGTTGLRRLKNVRRRQSTQ